MNVAEFRFIEFEVYMRNVHRRVETGMLARSARFSGIPSSFSTFG